MKDRLLLLIITVFVGAVACSKADILFKDTFNRANNADMDAVITGMSGSIAISAGNVYYQTTDEFGDSNSGIVEGQWNRLNSAGGVGLLHDFQEGDLLTNGDGKYHMKISLDVVENSSRPNDDRYTGFGLGFSRDSITNLVGGIGADTVRGNDAGSEAGIAGFFVNYRPDNIIQVFEGGSIVTNLTGAASLEANLSVDFLFDGIAAGSNVNYTIFDDGSAIYTGSYILQNDENYLAFGARNNSSYAADNFTVETIPEPATIGLLLATGGGLLFARRSRRSVR